MTWYYIGMISIVILSLLAAWYLIRTYESQEKEQQ